MTVKQAMVVNDLSGFGRCSLTVALPILSAANVQTSVIPTAVLSTHTAYPNPHVRSMTSDISMIADHWKSLNLRFDAVYTGYLSSVEQAGHVEKVIDSFKTPDNIVIVDPVMGDNGCMYNNLTVGFPDAMKRLCSKADIIVPNMTEAALLLGKKYSPGSYKFKNVEKIAVTLSEFGCRYVVLTGVYTENEEIGAVVFDKKENKLAHATAERINGHYHGTGDIFTSTLLAFFLNGFDIFKAASKAASFTAACIDHTNTLNQDPRYGVNFEAAIPSLLKMLREDQ